MKTSYTSTALCKGGSIGGWWDSAFSGVKSHYMSVHMHINQQDEHSRSVLLTHCEFHVQQHVFNQAKHMCKTNFGKIYFYLKIYWEIIWLAKHALCRQISNVGSRDRLLCGWRLNCILPQYPNSKSIRMVTWHQCIFSKLHLFNMSYTILPNLFDIYSNPVFPHSQWMISKGLLCSGWTGSKWPGLIRRLALHLFINFTLQFLPPFLPVFLLFLFFYFPGIYFFYFYFYFIC